MVTSTQNRSASGSAQSTQVSTTTEALTPQQIQSLIVPAGYINVSQAQLVQFAVAEAHSPATPGKLIPTLKFQDAGTGAWYFAPLSQITGYSSQSVPDEMTVGSQMTEIQSGSGSSSSGSGSSNR